MENIGFIGLGIMGKPMVLNLLKAGFSVSVLEKSAAAKEVQLSGAKLCSSPRLLAESADTIITMLPDSPEVESVLFGDEGIVSTMKEGQIFIDMSTISPLMAHKIHAELSKIGVDALDAPVSGGQAGAENGQLTVMIGGEDKDFEKAQDIIKCYSKKMKVLGPAGSGQLAKMVNQICIVGLVQGLSEGIRFGQNAGLNMEDVIEVISKGAAQSWQMENRYKTMIQGKFDFGFAVDWMRKDLGIAMDEAKNNGSDLPITKIIDGYYSEVQKNSGNRFDTSSLITRLKKNK